MPYITSFERLAREEGRKEGRAEGREEGRREELLEMITLGLQRRFPEEGSQLLPAIREITDLQRLRSIHLALWTANSLDEVRQLLPG